MGSAVGSNEGDVSNRFRFILLIKLLFNPNFKSIISAASSKYVSELCDDFSKPGNAQDTISMTNNNVRYTRTTCNAFI